MGLLMYECTKLMYELVANQSITNFMHVVCNLIIAELVILIHVTFKPPSLPPIIADCLPVVVIVAKPVDKIVVLYRRKEAIAILFFRVDRILSCFAK